MKSTLHLSEADKVSGGGVLDEASGASIHKMDGLEAASSNEWESDWDSPTPSTSNHPAGGSAKGKNQS